MNLTDPLAKKTVRLYSDLGWKSLFVRIRFLDAPYEYVETLLPQKGNIIDLGCGEGFFSNYAALKSKHRTLYGIEMDSNRIRIANRKLPNTKFVLGDVTKSSIPQADALVFFHLLHHLASFADQETLIKKCKSKLKKGGKLIVIEIEPTFSLKYFVTWFVDHFIVPWLFEGRFYSKIYFRKKREWIRLLEQLGFSVKGTSITQHMPFSHVVFECTKK